MKEEDNSIKVLIVDDSAVFRKILESLLSNIKSVEIVGKVSSGKLALKKIKSEKIDLVLLDVMMPEIDGLEVLQEIKSKYPHVITVMISGASALDRDVTVKALELGALDFIEKHTEENIEKIPKHIFSELERVVRISKKINTKSINIENRQSNLINNNLEINLVCIGTSTGGPQALMEIIKNLNCKDIPIVIIQHMQKNFLHSLAKHMNEVAKRRVKEVENQEQLKPGVIYLAPGDLNFTISSSIVNSKFVAQFSQKQEKQSYCPSIDNFLESMPAERAQNVLCAILTGMGKDGLEGCKHLKRYGGYVIAQDRESSTVFGMPQQVIRHNLANEILPLSCIAHRINQLTERTVCKTLAQ